MTKAQSSQDAKRVPKPTGICDIVSAPKRYCGKLIKVRSRVESDGIEHTVLLDDEERCDKGVVPWTKKTSDYVWHQYSFGILRFFGLSVVR